ncbi:MAG TPA: FAD-binding domain [Gammaproteobacteria bacterium]|nr:FAD-binding domain [Gammaproteobacteria bacterium]
MKIAINGAGIAGPTLAWWLRRDGHEVVLIEASPRLRQSGYVIDFWGLGYDVAERMHLVPRLRELGYQVEAVRFVDRRGRTAGGFATDVFERMTNGRFTSLRRSDLAAEIFAALDGGVESVFGESIAAIEEHAGGVRLELEGGGRRDVDLVIGADGLHSRVRRLVFGAEASFERDLGYYVAAFALEGYTPRDELVYVSHAAPGRQVSRFSMRNDETLFLFVFRKHYLAGGEPSNPQERQAALEEAFAGVAWECPQIFERMPDAGEIYFDRVSQIVMNRWTRGRTALIGDAAACVSLLAGEGAGLAMAEARILAGELARAEGDYRSAFARYEARLMPFLRRKQASAARFASSFAPGTAAGIVFRNVITRLMRLRPVADYFVGRDLRDGLELSEDEQSGPRAATRNRVA